MKQKLSLIAVASLITLSACSVLSTNNKNLDYRGSSNLQNPLEIPPNLNQSALKPKYAVPGQEVSAQQLSDQLQDDNKIAQQIASNSLPGMELKIENNQAFLELALPVEKVWELTTLFWQNQGLTLIQNEPIIGLMETNWAESRANIADKGIKKAINSLINIVRDTGIRDKYKTIFVKTDNVIQLYIIHSGMEEVYTNKSSRMRDGDKSTAWQPSPADKSKELVMLRRLMLYLNSNR